MNAISIQINRTKSVKSNYRSSSPTEIQKHISREINKSINANFPNALKEIGYQRINFDADLRGKSIVISKAFLIHESGEVEVLNYRNKIPVFGNRITTRLKVKVRSIAMTIHIPTPILLFNKEVESFFRDGLLLNLSISAVLGGLVALSGVTQETLFNFYILLFATGLIDYGLHAFPQSVVGKKKKDDKFLAKMWVLLFNMVLMTGMFVVNAYLQNKLSNPSGIQNITIHLPFIGMHLLIVPYYLRMLKLFVKVNKIKTPTVITDLKKRIFG